MAYESIGKAFVEQYYAIYDSNRSNLQGLYKDESMMTFEGAQCRGVAQITTKLAELKFKVIKHVLTSYDIQPVENGILVFVVGQLKTDDDPPIGFSEIFLLKAGGNSFFIFNQIFRLALHHGKLGILKEGNILQIGRLNRQ